MPSIIVKHKTGASDEEKLRKGMVFLGATFDAYYADDTLTPLSVLFMTFQEIANDGDYKIYFQVKETDDAGNATPIDKELKFKGLNGKATGLKFKIKTPAYTKKVYLIPAIDDFDPTEDKAYAMNVPFPKERKSEIGGGGYLSKNVDDIVTVGGGDPATLTTQLNSRKYLFASISYRRCI